METDRGTIRKRPPRKQETTTPGKSLNLVIVPFDSAAAEEFGKIQGESIGNLNVGRGQSIRTSTFMLFIDIYRPNALPLQFPDEVSDFNGFREHRPNRKELVKVLKEIDGGFKFVYS